MFPFMPKKSKEETLQLLANIKNLLAPVDPQADLEKRLERVERVLDAIEDLIDKATNKLKG